MITMVDKNRILISYYRESENISSISCRLKISRQTVRKYIFEHEDLYGKEQAKLQIENGLSSKPKYDSSGRLKRRLTDEVSESILKCLSENKEKRSKGLHKQQMKKIDIYEYLLEQGYNIGYTTVCNYIRGLVKSEKESFIKQLYSPGDAAEFDWGDVKLYIAGKLLTLNMAAFTSAYSNHRWAKLFYRQDTLAFSQSHIDYFEYLQGAHRELVYDNMRVAIRKFVGHNIKEPTIALLELSNYYKFDFRFCNIRKGNEKGHVERSVEYVRRKSFSRNLDFKDISEANLHLLKVLNNLNNKGQQLSENKTANELFEDEKKHLYQTNIPYKCFAEDYAKVDKYSVIILFGNRYSVPDFLVGKLLEVKIFAEKIDIYYNKEFVCSHVRNYGAHAWVLDINHYLTTLSRKPGALKGSLVFSQVEEKVKNLYNDYFTDDSRGFIELLKYCKDKNIDFDMLEKAIEKLKQISPLDINKDKILMIIDKNKSPETKQDTDSETYKFAQTMLNELTTIFN
jgi:transposase